MEETPTGVYGRLARWIIHHPWPALSVLVLVTVVSGFFASKVRVDSDILKLMPQDDPATIAVKRLDDEGGANVLTISAESDDPAQTEAFVSELEKKVSSLPQVEFAIHKIDPDTAFRAGLLQIPMEDLLTLRDRLQGALSFGPAIANPLLAGRMFDLGPLSKRLSESGSTLRLSNVEGMERLVIRPTHSAHDIPFARELMHGVYKAIDELKPEERGVRIVWIGGGFRHNVEDYEGIVKDITWTAATSSALVLLILLIAFRTPWALLHVFGPLIVSNIWTLGIAGGTVGSLNTFTSFTNAVLIGVGVEFGVHLYSRYREQIAEGLTPEAAVIRTWDLIGGSCTSAAFTSAAGFASLLAAHFAGFQQLGWLLSLGLLLTLASMLVVMPLTLTWVERRRKVTHHKHAARKRRRKLPVMYRLAPVALLVLASVTAVSGILARKIGFEFDISELRRAGLAYEDLSEKEQALAKESYAPVVATFSTEAERDAAQERLEKEIAEGKLPEIKRVVSVRTVLPKDQEARIAVLKEIAALAADPNVAFLPAPVQESLTRLKTADLRPLSPADLPVSVQQLMGARNGKHRLLIVPSGNMWDMREAEKITDVIARELPGVEAAGEYTMLGNLLKMLRRDAPVIAAIAAALVCFFTFLDLRSVQGTLGAMAVQVAGLAWWVAFLVLAQIKISVVNFVGIPIVFGIGIDVMIHLIHRIKEEGPGRLVKALTTTGWASALGTSTTVVAFAGLSLASSNGIRSLGLLVLLGETAVTVAGFILVPIGFATIWAIKGRTPPKEEAQADE